MSKERAVRAKAILDDDLTQEALNTIEETCRRKWEESNIDDIEGQRECKKMLHVAKNFRKFFEQAILDQEIDEKLLERKKKYKIF